MSAAPRDLSSTLPEELLLDGGFGTSLMERGLDIASEPTAAWNLTHPDEVLAVHRRFADAGSGALQTNTFGANRLALAQRSSIDVRECTLAASALARKAAGDELLVMGCIGPTSQIPPPQGDANLLELEDVFGEQAALLAEGAVDFLHIETMAHPKEMRAALLGARQGAPKLPVVVSITAKRIGERYKTTQGFSIESMLKVGLEERAEGMGANCMLAPADMLDLIKLMVDEVSVPVFAQPTIAPDGGVPLYHDEFADGVAALFEAGARAVGGCCGTGPRDIDSARRRMQRGYR
ncbi:MAG: homocysteine S-methyltransferase family protein [Myxococcales bacterium]|nr:homocysteine S-methyltransferase family protein [Myxococcales bacterium]